MSLANKQKHTQLSIFLEKKQVVYLLKNNNPWPGKAGAQIPVQILDLLDLKSPTNCENSVSSLSPPIRETRPILDSFRMFQVFLHSTWVHDRSSRRNSIHPELRLFGMKATPPHHGSKSMCTWQARGRLARLQLVLLPAKDISRFCIGCCSLKRNHSQHYALLVLVQLIGNLKHHSNETIDLPGNVELPGCPKHF